MANNTGTFFNVNDNDGIPVVGISTDGKVMINHLYGNCLIGSTSVTGTISQPLQVTGGAYVSGNLGIGTTNPSVKLDVIGAGNFTGDVVSTGYAFKSPGDTDGGMYSTEDGNIFFKTDNTERVRINTTGNVGIGTTNPTSKLHVIGSLLSTGNITGGGFNFVLGNTDQSTRGNSGSSRALVKDTGTILALNFAGDFTGGVRVDSRISVDGTITATVNNSLTETRGSHLRITNSGNGGDAVISWDNNLNGTNKQRWYAGIDVSDSNAWKLARPDTAYFDNESFDRNLGGGFLPETKLKIDTSGNATFLGNLTAGGGLTLNTNKFTVAGATGNTVIAGSLDIGGAFNLTASGSNKFYVDVSGNVTNSGTLTSSGKIKTLQDLEVTTSVTVGTTLGVTGQITASSFKVTSATDESLLLRATGAAKALTKAELDAAAGFTIQRPVVNTELPNGNSIQLLPLTFDGNGANGTRIFALQKVDNTAFTPISAANLLVSVGGVIQQPNTDYTVSGSNITFPASAWTNPPAAGLSCFIIAFGGLGGLRQNQDWDTADKGVLLVGKGVDNEAVKLGVGSDNQILTADSTTASGLAWKSSFAGNAASATTAASCSGNAATATYADNAGGLTGTPNITVGTVTATGDVTAYSTSDQRLKDNISPIPNALEKVLSISGNTFDWNEKSGKKGSDVGVIAQEILEVLPDAVTTRDNEYLAVRYEKLVPLLIEAIKEQQETIKEQQETITNLQNRLEILEGK